MKFHVEPVSADVKVPPHPMEGPMPAEGAHWIADQYTLRLILGGVIRRVPEKVEEKPADAVVPAGDEASAFFELTKAGEASSEAPAGPAAPSDGTVASAPFMITAATRKRLRALGKTEDEIAQMKPEDAQALLNAAPAPGAPAPQEA